MMNFTSLGRVIKQKMQGKESGNMVVVYQMGKVGSTSICRSLHKYSIEAVQTHFLDFDTFHKAIDRFRNIEMADEAVHHLSEQLKENIVLRHKIDKKSAAKERVKVITLAREPLSWYVSNFIQNFFVVDKPLRVWLEKNSKSYDGALGTREFRQYFEELFSRFQQIYDSGESDLMAESRRRFRVARQAGDPQADKFFYPEITKMLNPQLWFDTHFKTFCGVDVYQIPFDRRKGYAIIEAEGMDILLLTFESLSNNQSIVGEFCGLDSFSLVVENATQGKPHERAIKSGLGQVELHSSLMAGLFGSAYYRHFYGEPGTSVID